MRAFLLVPLDPAPNDPPRLLKCLEHVLPDTLLFQAPKEPFEHPVLLWRIGRDELLLQAIVATGLPKPPTLEDPTIVASMHGGSDRTQRFEPHAIIFFVRLPPCHTNVLLEIRSFRECYKSIAVSSFDFLSTPRACIYGN